MKQNSKKNWFRWKSTRNATRCDDRETSVCANILVSIMSREICWLLICGYAYRKMHMYKKAWKRKSKIFFIYLTCRCCCCCCCLLFHVLVFLIEPITRPIFFCLSSHIWISWVRLHTSYTEYIISIDHKSCALKNIEYVTASIM